MKITAFQRMELKKLCDKYSNSGDDTILVKIENITDEIFYGAEGTHIFLYEIQEDFVSFYNFVKGKKTIHKIKFAE